MAMDNDNLFSTIDDDIESLEIDNTFGPSDTTESLTPATAEDKAKAAEDGKAESKEEKEKRETTEAKIKAAEEKSRKAIDSEFSDPDDTDEPQEKVKKNDGPADELEGIEAFSKDLVDINFFTLDDGEELPKTNEELLAKLHSEKERGAEDLLDSFISKYGDEYKEAFDAIFVNGVSPKEYLSKFEQIQSYKEMDLTDEDNQIKVVTATLRKQGWEDDDIKEKIKSLKLNSELEIESQRDHKALVRNEEADLKKIAEQEKLKVAQKQAQENHYRKNIRDILTEKLKTKDFDGIPITKESANKTIALLEDKKWKLPSGELITDFDAAILDLNRPENHDVKVKIGLLIGEFIPGKPIKLNLDKIAKVAASKEKTEIFNSIAKNRNKDTSKKEKVTSNSNYFTDL